MRSWLKKAKWFSQMIVRKSGTSIRTDKEEHQNKLVNDIVQSELCHPHRVGVANFDKILVLEQLIASPHKHPGRRTQVSSAR